MLLFFLSFSFLLSRASDKQLSRSPSRHDAACQGKERKREKRHFRRRGKARRSARFAFSLSLRSLTRSTLLFKTLFTQKPVKDIRSFFGVGKGDAGGATGGGAGGRKGEKIDLSIRFLSSSHVDGIVGLFFLRPLFPLSFSCYFDRQKRKSSACSSAVRGEESSSGRKEERYTSCSCSSFFSVPSKKICSPFNKKLFSSTRNAAAAAKPPAAASDEVIMIDSEVR